MNKKIALFIGSDVSANLIAFELIEKLHHEGIYSVLIYPKHIPSTKPIHPDIGELGFYERKLLNQNIFPFLDHNYPQCISRLTPANVCQKYQTILYEAENINSEEFLLSLQKMGVVAGLSIRCYQKFGTGIIDYFKQHGFLWNLHPGILPNYRGVMTLFRSLNHGDKEFGYSLHEIDLNWDAGSIIGIEKDRINYQQCFLTNMLNLSVLGTKTALPFILKAYRGEPISSLPQSPAAAKYFTFPTPEELNMFYSKKLKLIDKAMITKNLAAKFSCKTNGDIDNDLHTLLIRQADARA